jgi:hypothetical protein
MSAVKYLFAERFFGHYGKSNILPMSYLHIIRMKFTARKFATRFTAAAAATRAKTSTKEQQWHHRIRRVNTLFTPEWQGKKSPIVGATGVV